MNPSMDTDEENDAKDEKSIVKLMKSKLPQFSNEADWEMAIFELSLVLDRVWPHKDDLNIMEYMTNPSYNSHPGMRRRADSLIYFALTLSAKKDSYAKMQIMAASHKDAVPCVLTNEGKKLYQMFQGMFTMTNLHQASLPSVRADFYAIAQKENETILQYTSRVDITVATLAKLGEKISTGAWIYALGNGLHEEYKDCKHGILYNKPGFDTVMSVKTKLLSEEAVITSKNKKASTEHSKAVKEKEDEIALLALKTQESREANATNAKDKSDTETKENAFLLVKGKGGKGKGKGKPNGGSRWYAQDWQQWGSSNKADNPHSNPWTRPLKGKGRGKAKGFDAQNLWCDIHQKYGHSTDWCFENPNRTNGAPPPSAGLWCETCNRTGHTANDCYATSIKISPKGKGKKGNSGDRNWKSQNFPASYSSEQATPALHEESSSTKQVWWQDHELGSVLLDGQQQQHTNINDNEDQQHNTDNAMDDEHAEANAITQHASIPDSLSEGTDDEISAYIDLVILAIVTNINRQQRYSQNPSDGLLKEIQEHSAYITSAEECTNIHIRRIIREFKTLINYEETLTTERRASITTIKTDHESRIEIEDSGTAEIETECEAELQPGYELETELDNNDEPSSQCHSSEHNHYDIPHAKREPKVGMTHQILIQVQQIGVKKKLMSELLSLSTQHIIEEVGSDPKLPQVTQINHEMILELIELRQLERQYMQQVAFSNELVLMVRDNCVRHDAVDSSLNAVHVIGPLADPHDQLELDEQRSHDHNMGQMQDDILYEENEATERIIEAFESLNSSDNGSERSADYHYEPPDSSEDDLYENTDTDDGIEELIDEIGGNTKLIAFLQKQRATIFRLRARIARMNGMLADAGLVERTTQHQPHDTTGGTASVLMDSETDMSCLLKPLGDPAATTKYLYNPTIKNEIASQLAKIQSHNSTTPELWMYFDSGASRSVISTSSPIRKHLNAIQPTYGSCSIGNGTPLHYIEKGNIKDNLEITVVKDLKYDLFSSVSAAKLGLTSVIDFDLATGENHSYTIDKLNGNVTPLVERGRGILELPLHLMIPTSQCLSLTQNFAPVQPEFSPNVISTFWHYYDDPSFDPATRENNTTELSLFTFDILKSLSERERDFLIHARLGHLPRKSILQMIKNGTTGIDLYSGKFKELCKPCMQAKQRAENHGREHERHPKGRPGEHLHSDLAILSTLDHNGNKYVLTVVDEISHEIVIALLKRKTADDVFRVSQKIQLSITARTGNKLLTWQFDRGTEFLNSTFEKWLKLDLGVTQRFSNIEHPWENGMAERSFQTLFALARSMLKHADLPDRLWGKAVLHSVYLHNRSPTSALGGIAPLQFRTNEPIDLKHMRVFGSPAQIFLRPTIRKDKKLSDRSVSGTFVGISDKGNGYIFLVRKSKNFGEIDSKDLVEIDSKDVKFNETFAEHRERKGKLTTASNIDPDLRDEHNDVTNTNKETDKTNTSDESSDNDDVDEIDPTHENKIKNPGKENDADGKRQPLRQRNAPRQFLLPGSHTDKVNKHKENVMLKNLCNATDKWEAAIAMQPFSEHELETRRHQIEEREIGIRRQQYSNVSLDNLILDCMEAQLDDETKLMKELELLSACAFSTDNQEMLMSTLLNEQDINLSMSDPKSQNEIDRMDPKDAERFNKATVAEVNGMKHKNVFKHTTLDELPQDTKIYQSIVNWTSKTNLGVYVKTKCRICFGGHIYDKSYTDTFAPTVNFCTVLVIICLSAMFGWFIGGLDYSQAYLNADIDEICVMRAPISVREYNSRGQEYYWLLKKAIYGHPKASRLWADCLHKKLVELGYTQFLTDQCVYGRWENWNPTDIYDNKIPDKSSFIFLLIHSDDIIIVSHDDNIMNAAKAELLQAFEGTDNGRLTSFCGVEIRSSKHHISLSMEYYWNKLMQKFNVKPDEIENAPLKTKIKRSECPAEPDEKLKNSYLQIIGSIIYGYTHCRLDLAYPVNMLTRIMHSPAEEHFNLLKKLLHYINGTKNWTLNYYRDFSVFYGMDFIFFCNVDAAHADDEETHRSTGGWFFFLRKGQGAVAAKSGQTKDIPLSSTESETIWGSNAAMQGAFLKQFLDETRLFKSTSFEMHEDCQPMINAQKRNVSQSRFKHMRTKHHYIRKLIFDGWCKLIKIPTKMNTADMATKILSAASVAIFSKIVLGLPDTLQWAADSEYLAMFT